MESPNHIYDLVNLLDGEYANTMKYLLFEGSTNVGKTNAIIRFAHNLLSNHGYSCIVGKIPAIGSGKDFQAVLEKAKSSDGLKKVIINSASDTTDIINDALSFTNANSPYDAIISSCREESYLYKHFYTVFNISNSDKVFEIPMAKINHRNVSLKQHGMKWYKEKTDKLADYLFINL